MCASPSQLDPESSTRQGYVLVLRLLSVNPVTLIHFSETIIPPFSREVFHCNVKSIWYVTGSDPLNSLSGPLQIN